MHIFVETRFVKMNKILSSVILLLFSSVFLIAEGNPLYTTGITITEKGELLLSEKGTKSVDRFSADGSKKLQSYPFEEMPTGIIVDGTTAYVTTFETKGMLYMLDIESGRNLASIRVDSGARGPLFSSDKKRIYVCNQFSNTVSEIDVSEKKVVRTAPVLREPRAAVLSKDEKFLFVINFLPAQRADVDVVCAAVSVIEMSGFTKVKDIPLANGSNALRGICITPDGKYIYVSHNLGRFQVPTSQLQQGWMNTSAFSIVDVEKQEYLGSVLVDEAERGAAGVWAVACNEDQIFISHSGTHEVSVIDHKEMLKKFMDYPEKENLDYDLQFLHGLRTRIQLEGNGPRDMVLTDSQLFIPTYFADILNILDIKTLELKTMDLNPSRVESPEDKGEKYFNDAMRCFQGWQSCNGCHPGEGRTDGMNWDLMNDGIGNPKNCKSMLFSHVTPPCMISGIRAQAELAVRAGYRHIQFFEISEEEAECVDAYLKALRPVPSPYLVDGELSEKAKQGRKVFEKMNCGNCHSGPYFTDMKLHRIGEDIEFENGWDTPTLREVWRTAPYLFDGRAATMKDVFEAHKHGLNNKKITQEEIDALVEYVNSL